MLLQLKPLRTEIQAVSISAIVNTRAINVHSKASRSGLSNVDTQVGSSGSCCAILLSFSHKLCIFSTQSGILPKMYVAKFYVLHSHLDLLLTSLI